MEKIIFIVAVLIFIGYLTYIVVNFGIPKSISASYYLLPEKYRPLFTLILWALGLSLIFVVPSIEFFIAGSGICFVGASPGFKDLLMEKKVHMASAIIGISMGMIGCITQLHSYILFGIGAALIGFLGLTTIKNYITYIELVAFLVILLSVLIYV